MIRVGNIALMSPLGGGTDRAHFTDPSPRLVRLTVNTPALTAIFYAPLTHLPDDDETPVEGEPILLATVLGLEDIEFYTDGAFTLSHDGDAIWLNCKDGDNPAIDIPDDETFTRIAERRPRNPEIERLQHMLMANQERRMGVLTREIARERARLDAEREALHRGASAAGGNQPPAQPANSPGEPAPRAPASGVGTEGGSGDASGS